LRLGAWLLSKGKITDEQLQRALQHQSFFGGRLGSSLIKLGYIDEDVLGAYLSDVAGTPYAPPSMLERIAPETLAVVPGRLAAQYRVVPLSVEGRRLRLAMRDPKDLIALDEIAFLTGLTIEPYVATEFRMQQALQRFYQVEGGAKVLPVAEGAAAQSGVSARPAPSQQAPRSRTSGPTPGRDIGLDGFPLDLSPDEITSPLPALSPEDMLETDDAPPTSLQQWRMAQQEIPDELPEPLPPARLATETASAAAAIAAAPAAPVPAAAPAPWAERAPAVEALPKPVIPAAAPPAAPAAVPVTLEAIAERLRQAQTRDEVFAAVLDYAAGRFQRCALFVVQPDRLLGWSGTGEGIDPARVRQVTVPLDRPSLFGFFRGGADFYFGPVSDLPATTRFYQDLGCAAPARALLLPLTIKERPMVILYADDGSERGGSPDIPSARRLLAKAALALEILILRNKITSL
jgi:hypothetical protein